MKKKKFASINQSPCKIPKTIEGDFPFQALDHILHQSPLVLTVYILVVSDADCTARYADFLPHRYSFPCPISCPEGYSSTESQLFTAFIKFVKDCCKL